MENIENTTELTQEEFNQLLEKIQHLLKQPHISYTQYKELSDREKEELRYQIDKHQALAPIEEYPQWDNKLTSILDTDQRTDRWQYIHLTIMNAIRRLMKENNAMPNYSEIAQEVGMHRNTVRAHMREYEKSTLYKNQLQQYRFAATAIVDKLMIKAMDGDNRSAKVFIECLPKIESWQVSCKANSNSVVIKGVELTQEALDTMSEAKLISLQEAVLAALPSDI